MGNFIRLTSIKNPRAILVTSVNIKYNLGDEVVITDGEFVAYQGRVARITGQQMVVVELFDGRSVERRICQWLYEADELEFNKV